jgi:hypothetical protein
LTEAAKRLEIPNGLHAGIACQLGPWIAAGYPERSKEEIDRLWRAPCDRRAASGLCLASGCGHTPAGTIYCLWLCRMATAACPAKHFFPLRLGALA